MRRVLYRRLTPIKVAAASCRERGPWDGLDLYHGPRTSRFDPLMAQLRLSDREGNLTLLGLLVFVPLMFLGVGVVGALIGALKALL